jgi:hypothetical protein
MVSMLQFILILKFLFYYPIGANVSIFVTTFRRTLGLTMPLSNMFRGLISVDITARK